MSTPPRIYTNRIGVVARILDTVEIAGQTLEVVAMITPSNFHRVEIVGREPGAFKSWTEATYLDWAAAEKAAAKAHAKTVQAAQDRADAETYGVEVLVGRDDWKPAWIVRTTKTQLVDHSGRRWTRRTGRAVGQSRSWGGHRIKHEDRLKLEVYLDGRDKVDIVRERKAAAK